MSPSRFSPLAQLASVVFYFGTDLFLRFNYQNVLENYSKPVFLAICCYAAFALWGPLVVFPYVKFVKKSTITQYYKDWSGDLSFLEALGYTIGIGIILLLGNIGYIAGLRYINVALASALSQGEAPFTVALSVWVLGRVFGVSESRGIWLSFIGILLISVPPVIKAYREEENRQDTWDQIGGILTTLFGAFGFGCYQCFWPLFDGKRYSKSAVPSSDPVDAIIDALATLAIVGTFLIITGWIPIVLLHIMHIERFELPAPEIRGALAFTSVLSALVDATNGIACVVATAVVVALAYPLIIPISIVMQTFISGIPISAWGYWGWIGTVFVVAGVFCLEANSVEPSEAKQDDYVEMDATSKWPVDARDAHSQKTDDKESDDEKGVLC